MLQMSGNHPLSGGRGGGLQSNVAQRHCLRRLQPPHRRGTWRRPPLAAQHITSFSSDGSTPIAGRMPAVGASSQPLVGPVGQQAGRRETECIQFRTRDGDALQIW